MFIIRTGKINTIPWGTAANRLMSAIGYLIVLTTGDTIDLSMSLRKLSFCNTRLLWLNKVTELEAELQSEVFIKKNIT